MKKIAVMFFVLCFFPFSWPPQSRAEGKKGQNLFEKKCGICHSIKRPKSKRKTREQWEATVMRMKDRNRAPISAEEARIIIDYLVENYGK
ncbi:MAG: hypothetical protein JRJ03_18250 [Deltaproteobacteria bacterium]|nr:hypothetical protein [Deltaproteobacteria bacterium]